MERLKVLIVDDEAKVRNSLGAMLRAETTIEVIAEAGDGQEALVKIAENKPDLVLMNIFLPKLGGIEATHAIKAQWPKISVILLTGLNQPALLRRALMAGAEGLLPKTVTRQLLISAIAMVTSGGLAIEADLWHRFFASLLA